jgi:hypothetical protein
MLFAVCRFLGSVYYTAYILYLFSAAVFATYMSCSTQTSINPACLEYEAVSFPQSKPGFMGLLEIE